MSAIANAASGGSRPVARHTGRWAGLALAHIIYIASVPGAWALQILEATDHAELTAEISASAVNRIALDGDRVSRVVQSPSALTVEHDPVRGDVYVHADGSLRAETDPITLYLGSERGFTYRLTLRTADRDSAQILIRNANIATATDERGGAGAFESAAEGRLGELVALIRAVARGEPLPGYAIVVEPPVGEVLSGPAAIETWRGARWTARVFAHGNVLAHGNLPEHGDDDILDAAALAEAAGPGVVAAWMSPPGGPADSSPAHSRPADTRPTVGVFLDGQRIGVVVEASPGADR